MRVLPGFSAKREGPVAKYNFTDGNIKDEVGSNNARKYNVIPIDDRFGNARSAFFFQGNFDSYISLGTSARVKPKEGSISLWVRVEQEVYKGKGVLSNPIIFTRAFPGEDFNDAYVITYGYEIDKIFAANSNSAEEQVNMIPVKTFALRKWYHLVLTYDNKYSCFYVDGVVVSRVAKNFTSRFLETDSVIVGGQLGKKNSRYFQGMIDDIEIYDRVITPAEVLKLYNAPNPNKKAIIIKWVEVGVFSLLILLVTAWWVRRRIKKAVDAEKEKSRMRARILDLETKALRSQMNPHFVFNALNTLQRFILEDNKEKSYTYLIELSRLLRKLLESSESDTISLAEEREILNAYLEIEKLRFDNAFEYRVETDIAQPELVFIPIMFIQPFAENAIWHGLLNRKGLRLLNIRFTNLDEKRILCEVDDNGVGRDFKTKNTDTIKKKSLAIDSIRQRLELTRQSTGIECSLEIIDKKDNQGNSLGTTVKVILPKIGS